MRLQKKASLKVLGLFAQAVGIVATNAAVVGSGYSFFRQGQKWYEELPEEQRRAVDGKGSDNKRPSNNDWVSAAFNSNGIYSPFAHKEALSSSSPKKSK